MTATTTDNEVFEELMSKLDKPWVVLVLDDPVTPMDYVVAVFMKHFKLSMEVATKKMMEVHSEGSSVLDVGDKEAMQAHMEVMHAYRLQARIEQQD